MSPNIKKQKKQKIGKKKSLSEQKKRIESKQNRSLLLAGLVLRGAANLKQASSAEKLELC